MNRRSFLLLLATPLVIGAAPKSTPIATIQAVYAALPRPTPPELLSRRLRALVHKGDAATVEASFYNRGERRFRRFLLVREAGRWVVDDVLLVPENGKLADFLRGKG
jgi:hypothetical protein